jgi:hypothetical protein
VALQPELRVPAVPTYRLFRLFPDNQILGVSETVAFDSDVEVIDHAKAKLDGLAIDVWDGVRLVTRLKSTHE